MEAHLRRPWLGVATLVVCIVATPTLRAQFGQQRSVAQSENFIVFAATPQLAKEMSESAERWRKELAIHWLGQEIPAWGSRCPLHINAQPNLGAGGETRFTLSGGAVGNWMMSVQGTRERILDSVLPHEITHTIFASYFAATNKHVPRWADEGACTTVEHESEQSKHKYMLNQFLREGRGISFNRLFSLKDYPSDILPLYAQGHAVVEFLLAQGGPRKFVQFIEAGMRDNQWEAAVRSSYGYESLGDLKLKWNQWVVDGRGSIDLYVAAPRAGAAGAVALASNSRTANDRGLNQRGGVSQLAVNELAGVRSQMKEEGPSVQFVAGGPQPNATLLGEGSSEARGASQLSLDPPALSATTQGFNPASSALASNSRNPQGSGSDSWYREQFERNVRQIDRTNQHLRTDGQSSGIPSHGVSRPQPNQSAQVQVLEWGNLR